MDLRSPHKVDLGKLLGLKQGRGTGSGSFFSGPFLPGWLENLRKRKLRARRLYVAAQLEALVRNNCSLTVGLMAAEADAPDRAIRRVLYDLNDDLRAGLTLSEAMARQPHFFPKHHSDLIAVGAKTGKLGECLGTIADEQTYAMSVADTLRGHAAYLATVFTIQICILIFYALKINPVFVEILSELDVTLPGPAAFFVDLPELVYQGWGLGVMALLFALVMGLLIFNALRLIPLFRAFLARLIIPIPFLGNLLVKRNLARIAKVLEHLTDAGVPLDSALEDAAAIDVNPAFSGALKRARKRVVQGDTLASALNHERYVLPASFRRMVTVGENAGLLPDSFAKLSDFYKNEVVKKQKILIDMTAPLFILVLGAISLSAGLAFFSAYLSMVDSILMSM